MMRALSEIGLLVFVWLAGLALGAGLVWAACRRWVQAIPHRPGALAMEIPPSAPAPARAQAWLSDLPVAVAEEDQQALVPLVHDRFVLDDGPEADRLRATVAAMKRGELP